MKILHFFLGFPPFHSGGLMIYARDLAKEQLNKGHAVIMLMPGKYKDNQKKSYIKYYKTIDGLPVYQIVNGVPTSTSGVSNPESFMCQVSNNDYKDFLKENKFDVIHIHSLIGLPKEFVDSAKDLKIKTVFTTHDYYGICPKIKLYNYKHEQCVDYNMGLDCVNCNLYSKEDNEIRRRNRCFSLVDSILREIYKVQLFKNIYISLRNVKSKNINDTSVRTYFDNHDISNKVKSKHYVELRKYYFDIINNFDILLFNSSVTMKEYSKYLDIDNKDNYIIYVSHLNVKDNRYKKKIGKKDDFKVHFSYMGDLSIEKGFFDLLEVLERIRNIYTNWDISIFGDYSMINIDQYNKEYYHFYGRYSHGDLAEIFEKTDMLIIPSKWKETFGYIGLEAMSYNVPVLTSYNTGYSDLINSGVDGLVYNDDQSNDHLYESIAYILDNPSCIMKYMESLQAKDFAYGMSEHADKIISIYRGHN